jgi:hypothetical protein
MNSQVVGGAKTLYPTPAPALSTEIFGETFTLFGFTTIFYLNLNLSNRSVGAAN